MERLLYMSLASDGGSGGGGGGRRPATAAAQQQQQTRTENHARTAKSVSVPESSWKVISWLLTEGRSCRMMAHMVEGCVLEMRKHGIPVDRFFIGATLIHTQCSAYDWKWEACSGEVTEVSIPKKFYDRRYELFGADAPLIYLETHDDIRIRASDGEACIPENCRDLFQRGYVDLYGRQLTLQGGEYGGGITWAKKGPEAFDDSHIAFFDSIMPALSAIIQFFIKDLCMFSLLRTYLGNDPGTRVHRGCLNTLKGNPPHVTMRSVVWFSDVRGFTRLSHTLDRESLISLINEIFELSERVLSQRGGEVLKFMGDGLMGVFSAMDAEEEENICAIAREAAQDFQNQLAELRANRAKKGLPGGKTEVGVGLHFGDVSYGNIGTPTRLDFTVIGPAVNIASRVEGLCSTLKAPVLASEEFVKQDEIAGAWKSRGVHQMKGVEKPIELFELA